MYEPSHRVTVADIDIPFGRLVAILVKISLAAIPATIIVSVIIGLVVAAVMALLGYAIGPMRV